MKKIINTLFIGAMALFTFGACSDVPMPYEIGGGGNEDDGATLLSTTFAGGKGDFTIENKVTPEEMPEIWTTGANYIKATASKYMSDDQTTPTKFDAESWLISPSINLSSVTHATLTFEHAARYFYSDKSGMTVLVSETSTGVWEQVTIPTYPEGTDWTFVSSGDINLDKYIGKQIQIAFKYISTTSTSPTWELKNVLVEAREAEDSGETPSEGTGKGTKDDPYDIAAAKSKQDGKAYWVKAYIVGDVNGQVLAEGAEFVKPFSSNTNILIAATAGETNLDNCMPVQLLAGEVRNALNLKENENNLGKEILLYGTLEAYFRVAGVKNVSAASFDGGTTIIGKDPDATIPEKDPNNPLGLDDSNPVTSFSVDFEELTQTNYEYCPEGWTNVAMVGTRIWTGYVYNGDNSKYMQATAFGTTNTDDSNEMWFVSPAFKIDDTNKYVTFDCSTQYYKAGTTLKIYFLQLVGGKMEKEEITVANLPGENSKDNEWVKDLYADLSKYTGKTGFIGFQYCGDKTSATGTYRLDNIKTASKAPDGGDTPEPEQETVKVTKDQAYEESFASSFGKFTLDNKELGDLSAVWTIDSKNKYAKASAFKDNSGIIAESWLVSPIIDLSEVSKVTLSFMQASFSQGNASELMLKIRESASDTWTDLTMKYSTSKWEKVENSIDLSAYGSKKVVLAFVYKNDNTSAANTWEVWNVKVSADEGGTVDPTPSGDNLLSNASFETWTNGKANDWNINSAGNATISQSNEAKTGNSSVYVTNTSSNKRLGSKEYTLAAGTYSLSVYAKNATTEKIGKIRLGYVPVVSGEVQSSNYIYITEPTAVTNDWIQYSETFELKEETTVCIVVMSSKSTGDVLLDDTSLIKTK